MNHTFDQYWPLLVPLSNEGVWDTEPSSLTFVVVSKPVIESGDYSTLYCQALAFRLQRLGYIPLEQRKT